MKRIYIAGAFLTILIFNFLLLLKIIGLSNNKSTVPINFQGKEKEFRLYEKIDEGMVLSKENLILSALNNENPVSLNDFIADGPKLILRYTEKDCWSCVEDVLKICKKYSEENIGFKDSFMVLSSFSEHRNFLILHKSKDFDFPVLNLQNSSLDLKVDSLNIPYFFILNPNFTINSIFISERENYKLISDYLTAMKRKLRNY